MRAPSLAVLLLALTGCAAVGKHWPEQTRREIAAIIEQEHVAPAFEARLEKLGATFQAGTSPGEKKAFVPLRAVPDYMMPRAMVVAYHVGESGEVSGVHSEVIWFPARD